MLKHERTYVMSDSTPNGIKQIGHWRRGHFKGVWCGQGKTELETRWIEPYRHWINEILMNDIDISKELVEAFKNHSAKQI